MSNWYQAAKCCPMIAKHLKHLLADNKFAKTVGFTVTKSIGDQGKADIDLLLGGVKWAKPGDSAIFQVEFSHHGQSVHKSEAYERFAIHITCQGWKALKCYNQREMKVSSYSGQAAMKQELARLCAFYLFSMLKIEPIS